MDREIIVVCNKEYHKIILRANGRLSFPNHPNGFNSERVAIALGGSPCKCLEILNIWKNRENCLLLLRDKSLVRDKSLEILGSLKDSFMYTVNKTRFRNKARTRTPKSKATSYIHQNKDLCQGKRVINAFNVLLRTRMLIHKTDIEYLVVHYSYNGHTYFERKTLILFLSWRWYMDIYRKGLAVMDGYIVLNISMDPQNGDLTAQILKPTLHDIEVVSVPYTGKIPQIALERRMYLNG